MRHELEKDASRAAEEVDVYYEQAVLLYWHELRTFTSRRTGNIQDAEDIVQEAFTHAYFALERYSEQQRHSLKIRPWLYKIVWNVYCNYMSRIRPPATISLDTCVGNSSLEPEEEPFEHPTMVFERAESRQEWEMRLALLPKAYREAISLYYFEDFSQQEIADALQQPLGTVKTHLSRGLRLLRKMVLAKERAES